MGTNPQVTLEPQNANIELGQPIIIDVRLGNTDIPVENFYGIAIEMSYNPDFILVEEWEFEEAENAWYDPTNDDAVDVLMENEDITPGKISLAITRTNQQVVSGAGKLGELSIVIQDIIFLQDSDTLNLQIENIRMIDKDFNTLSVVPDSTFVIISKKRTGVTAVEMKNSASIKVFPNPVKDILTIHSDYVIESVELSDIVGRKIPFSTSSTQLDDYIMTIDIRELKAKKSQLCLLKVYTAKGLVVKKIILE